MQIHFNMSMDNKKKNLNYYMLTIIRFQRKQLRHYSFGANHDSSNHSDSSEFESLVTETRSLYESKGNF